MRITRDLIQATIEKLKTNPPKSVRYFSDGPPSNPSCCAIGWMAKCANAGNLDVSGALASKPWEKLVTLSDETEGWDAVIDYLQYTLDNNIDLNR